MQTIEHIPASQEPPAATIAPPADPRPSRRATQRIAVTPIVPRQKKMLSAREIQSAEDGSPDESEAHPS